MELTAEQDFRRFVVGVEPRLRRALVAMYGADRGREAVAEALSWAWANWDRVESMANPAGYLFRVGQSRTRRFWPRRVNLPEPESIGLPWVEPKLVVALRQMSEKQRAAVVLVHGYQYSLREVAELLDVTVSTVQTHVDRGLARLRRLMEVTVELGD